MVIYVSPAFGSEGLIAPPINGACAPDRMPVRLQRTRKRFNFTPQGARYVGRPTIHANPFERRRGIGHKRSVIFYDSWVSGKLTPYILTRMGFSDAEIAALNRWLARLIPTLPTLRGLDLQCWCALTCAWCHADILRELYT
jgi:hypothetical protein